MSITTQLTDPGELKYLTNGEIAREIVATVDGDTERYTRLNPKPIHVPDLRLVAKELQPEDDPRDLDAEERPELFEAVIEFANVDLKEEDQNRRHANSFRRYMLKDVHRELYHSEAHR